MSRGRHTSLHVTLSADESHTITAWQRRTITLPSGLARRGRILLLLTQGLTITEVAHRVGISRRFVYKWVARFEAQGLDGLRDKARPGRTPAQSKEPQ